MKTWCYNDPIFDGATLIGNDVVEVTEDQILEDYWSWWSKTMVERFGPMNPEITRENCIEDWVTSNWAWEKK